MLLRRDLAEVLIARRPDEGEMAMPLHHAWHKGHSAAVDDLRAVAANLPMTARDRGDAVIFDQHLGWIALIVLAVPNLGVHNKKGHGAHPPSRRRLGLNADRLVTFYVFMIGAPRAASPTLFRVRTFQKDTECRRGRSIRSLNHVKLETGIPILNFTGSSRRAAPRRCTRAWSSLGTEQPLLNQPRLGMGAIDSLRRCREAAGYDDVPVAFGLRTSCSCARNGFVGSLGTRRTARSIALFRQAMSRTLASKLR